jgi:hypothetical protein
LPTDASHDTEAAAEDKRSSYVLATSSMRNAFMRILANTLMYHSLVKTNFVKDYKEIKFE